MHSELIRALVVFAIALVFSTATTPAVTRLAHQKGYLDIPDHRRVHVAAIPRLGGVAIAMAFLLTGLLVALGPLQSELKFFQPARSGWLLATGSLIVFGAGLYDDIKGIGAKIKLFWQIVSATVAYAAGFRIEVVWIPGVGELNISAVSLLATVLWIVAIINALNLIDGLDGLAGGVAFFACVSNALVGHLYNNPMVVLLSSCLAGAISGFLVFNFNPAKIFMGDSGSMFLGYWLATLSLLGASTKTSTTVAILVPILALGLPIFDTLFAIARRFIERRPIFSPDRGHIHHKFLDMGLTHRRAVLILYSFSMVLAVAAVAAAMGRDVEVGLTLLGFSVVVWAIFGTLGSGRFLKRQRVSEEPRAVIRSEITLKQGVSVELDPEPFPHPAPQAATGTLGRADSSLS